ncbi:hypothetical protein LINPERHAP1_LOCUS4899 [Linum perenne]
MKTKYSNFKKLLSHTEMGYNEVNGQVTVDEEVWALAKDMEIEDVQFTKALGILEATVNFRQCFLRINEDMRMGWVRNLDCAKSD